jgi:hypothetical protein
MTVTACADRKRSASWSRVAESVTVTSRAGARRFRLSMLFPGTRCKNRAQTAGARQAALLSADTSAIERIRAET